ncbi:phage portal protein [Arthrobacter sp. UM1]|uniref:phage portal protein n=1 Tax=Arthrobacter sp. UM1 TaxID=2766776 RepID=UPI001CF70900|nr:phage portal protein [Arthrobacter sp. UM1]MCB4209168.1 phage portal protein [Arthrobacter sp. UM1]
MRFFERIFPGIALQARAAALASQSSNLRLPSREIGAEFTIDGALGLIPVFRALQVLTTSAEQIPLTCERGGVVAKGRSVPALVRRPDPDCDQSEWTADCIMSLALDGNLFLLKVQGTDGSTVAARVLPPHEVTILRDPQTRRVSYAWSGRTYSAAEIVHKRYLRVPGRERGLGPLQAARAEITGALDVRTYAALHFRGTGQPNGLLSLKYAKTPEDATKARKAWNVSAADPDNLTGVRVIGGDVAYTPLTPDPAKAQLLDLRTFTVTEVARLFGIPSSLMLVTLEGNSMTYSNVDQEWLGFVRFSLMGYLRKIERALTEVSPLGQDIRFNVEALLRPDTTTRYKAHHAALADGWRTPDEIREIEGLPPLTTEQRKQIEAHKPAKDTAAL